MYCGKVIISSLDLNIWMLSANRNQKPKQLYCSNWHSNIYIKKKKKQGEPKRSSFHGNTFVSLLNHLVVVILHQKKPLKEQNSKVRNVEVQLPWQQLGSHDNLSSTCKSGLSTPSDSHLLVDSLVRDGCRSNATKLVSQSQGGSWGR